MLCLMMRRCAVLLVVVAGGCYSDGFLCGTTLESDPSVIRTCSGINQICVCATNSCASKDPTCDSGYRYGPKPFIASNDLGDSCVPKKDIDGETISSGNVALCSDAIVRDMSMDLAPVGDLETAAGDSL